MEMVIQKIGSPVAGSTRKNNISRRWNSGTNVASPAPAASSKSSTKSLKEEPTTGHSGKSLLSFKAYYRKLRTFKGTVKALINLRCLSFSQTKQLVTPIAEAAQSSSRVASRVGKLSLDGDTLQEVQRQVESLVDGGHVVLELDRVQRHSVAYRQQGDLEHYTEANVRKRLSLKDNRLMIALTQRLWVTAVQTDDQKLHFADYEIYMLRLHRLILPEFDFAQSQELISEDWMRDSNGSDYLDYGFFHSSMFELVDLWTDTVEPEDYISLLYCIMHSLTYGYEGRYKLKELEDINPIDIVECSKKTSQEEIERDLASEMNGKDAQFYQDLATRETADDENEIANHSTIECGESTLLEGGADNTSLLDLANIATSKTEQLLGNFSMGKGDAQNDADPEALKPTDSTNQRTGQQKASGPKDKNGGATNADDSSSRDQKLGGNGNSVAPASASTPRKFLSAKARPRKTTTFLDYGNRLRMNIVYDPSIDPTTVDGGQLSSPSPPQPIYSPLVRGQYSASSKQIHGFPMMEKLPMASSNAFPSSVNHSNTVSSSSDVEIYDSKTDYLKKLPSSRAIIYPHTSAYPSSSGFLQLNGAPPKITTGHYDQDTSVSKTLDTKEIHSAIDDPNDPKAGEVRPSSSPFGSSGQGRRATSPRSSTYKLQLHSPSSASAHLHLKLVDGDGSSPLQGRNIAKYLPSPLSAINDMHPVASIPAEFSVSGQPVQTRGNRSSSLPEPIKDHLEFISLIGTNTTSPRSASRQSSDLNLVLSAVGTSPRSPSHQKQRSPRRTTARLQEGGSRRVSTPSIVSRSQQQSMNLEVQSHSLSPRKPQ